MAGVFAFALDDFVTEDLAADDLAVGADFGVGVDLIVGADFGVGAGVVRGRRTRPFDPAACGSTAAAEVAGTAIVGSLCC